MLARALAYCHDAAIPGYKLLHRDVKESLPICWCPKAYAHSTNPEYKGHPINKWARDGNGDAVFNGQGGQDWFVYGLCAHLSLSVSGGV